MPPQRDSQVLDLTAGEPILAFIARRPRVHLPLVSAALFLIAVAPILASFVEKTWASPAGFRGLSTDYAYFINIVIQSQLIMLVTYRYCRQLTSVLTDFKDKGVIRVGSEEYAASVQKSNALLSHVVFAFVPLAVATVTAFYSVSKYVFSTENTWQHQSVAGVLYGCAQFVLNYLICVFILRIALSYVAVSRFFRFDTHIQPLHPDGCGGLAPLGRLVTYIYPLILLQGLSISVGIYQDTMLLGVAPFHVSHIFLFACYLMGSALAVFLPLYSAHSRMKEAKQRMLTMINKRYEQAHPQAVAALAHDHGDISLFETVNRLRELHGAAQKMPVYPFNAKVVISFFVTVGIPILVVVEKVFPAIAQLLKRE